MTKKFNLEFYNDIYYFFGVEKNRKGMALCGSFINHWFDEFPVTSKLNVIISDIFLEGYEEIKVSKTGYYRWHYYNKSCGWMGVFPAVEDILSNFFPQASPSGAEEEKIWLKIEKTN